MRYIKLFEEYDPKIHQGINMTRKLFKNKTVNKILDIISIIDDIVHLDFKNIKNTFKNKEGYKKASELAGELGLTLMAMGKEDKNREEMDLFYDIRKYGLNVDMMINYLDDEEVIKYLDNDRRYKKRLDEYSEAINFLRKYKEWENGNKKMFK